MAACVNVQGRDQVGLESQVLGSAAPAATKISKISDPALTHGEHMKCAVDAQFQEAEQTMWDNPLP